jgi:hypothetical protein
MEMQTRSIEKLTINKVQHNEYELIFLMLVGGIAILSQFKSTKFSLYCFHPSGKQFESFVHRVLWFSWLF